MTPAPCAPSTSARPSRSPGGWRVGAITAGSRSSTSARRSGVVQVVVRDEAVAHSLRSEFCLKVVGEVVARKEGNENPNLATGEIEVVATEVEVLSASDPLPFPDRRRVRPQGRRGRRGGPPQAPLPRPAPLRPQRRPPPAQQDQQGRPRRARRPRLRRGRDTHADPLDARGRPRLPGARPAGARAAGTPCRRARSCSSSCSWSAAWSATTRSRAATATRTSAPTGSRSSPSSTSR